MSAWEEAIAGALATRSVLLVGEPDTGKTTFFLDLWARAEENKLFVGMIDGDLGQKAIGPPGTAGLALTGRGPNQLLHFVGDTTPATRQIEAVLAVGSLANRAWRSGCETVVVDTSGLVNGALGSRLKCAKAELLEVDSAIVLERGGELAGLVDLFESRGVRVFRVPVRREAKSISPATRAENRKRLFARYFASAERIKLDWDTMALLPPDRSRFQPNLLVGLLDAEWSTLAMGIVVSATRESLEILAPHFDISQLKVVEAGILQVASNGKELGRVR